MHHKKGRFNIPLITDHFTIKAKNSRPSKGILPDVIYLCYVLSIS